MKLLCLLCFLVTLSGLTEAQKYPEMIVVQIQREENKPNISNTVQKFFGKDKDQGSKEKSSLSLSTFSLSKTEVTVVQFKTFCSETEREMVTGIDIGDDFPISNITYMDAIAYCNWLSKKTGATYRLPYYNEWIFAFKGGAKSKNFDFSGSKKLEEIGWYNGNSQKKVKMVGMKKGNELGFYDMSGNVSEICIQIGENEAFNFITVGGSVDSEDSTCLGEEYHTLKMGEKSPFIGFRVLKTD